MYKPNQLGKILNSHKFGACTKPEVLIAAGYRQVPSHCEAFQKYEQEWITNVTIMGAQFPRFHIVKFGKQFILHYDVSHSEFSKVCITKGKKLQDEKERIIQIGNLLSR